MCSSAALAVLAGLALAGLTACATHTSHCDHLASLYNDSAPARNVSCDGREMGVALAWGSAPARAASALLLVLARHALHYGGLRLQRAPPLLANLAVKYNNIFWSEAVVSLSVAWKPGQPELVRAWKPGTGEEPGLAGPRLVEFGESHVAARLRLHVRLAPDALRRGCRAARWAFYSNTTALGLCGFLNTSFYELNKGGASPPAVAVAVVYYVVNEGTDLQQEVQRRAKEAGRVLQTQELNRTTLAHYIRTANHSFLFIDYDFWHEEPSVSVAEPPPCISVDVCQQELDSAIALRVTDLNKLQTCEPQLMRFVYDFKPSPESLRLILELEGNGTNIEEAACTWAVKHQPVLNLWSLRDYGQTIYDAYVFYCDDDPYMKDYDLLLKKVNEYAYKKTKKMNFVMIIRKSFINCSDTYNVSSTIFEMGKYVDIYRLVGVITAGTVGAANAASQAKHMRVPLLLLDTAPTTAASAAWRVAGSPRHLARALQRFVLDSGWTRLAVLSEQTTLAAEFLDEISDGATFALGKYLIPKSLSEQQAEIWLRPLRMNVRIVFVNADLKTSAVIMTAALKLGMSFDKGYVWIFREWPVAAANTTVLTVSFWARGVKGLPIETRLTELTNIIQAKWRDRYWPPRAAVLADAVLTLTAGLREMLLRYPNTRMDLRSDATMKALYKSLNAKNIRGINNVLKYKEAVVEESYVFVDEWSGEYFTRLAAWSVNASASSLAEAVRGNYTRPLHLPTDDGASRCLARGGDDFDPDCYDLVWITALLVLLVLLVLTPPALFLYRRALQRRIARLLKARESELLAQRQHVAAALTAYLVKREALELREELGAGHFGCVRLALLCLPAHASRYVAAKALRENAAPAEESEFLREACTIASLDHEHIVRLVGVCISDGPPLVLMELAFFGDLLGYLRARRHLVEGNECEGQESLSSLEEAVHVSAEALTRLAREAAAALAYLGSRGVVHRDVRAANCLVDARRSLKLADFGMARETVTGADGAPEYACRRRGMFPVLWMAPESLAHGVFSAATDVWALGVLVLELVTLGARPYGSMSPLRVLEYVAAGGRPPLPLDATPQMRGLARLCWQREAERRPSAAEVRAYLAARPRALRAALLSERDVPADADSGFGESPSTELLPPDSPLDSIDQLEV